MVNCGSVGVILDVDDDIVSGDCQIGRKSEHGRCTWVEKTLNLIRIAVPFEFGLRFFRHRGCPDEYLRALLALTASSFLGTARR